jgi:hypothetical protein
MKELGIHKKRLETAKIRDFIALVKGFNTNSFVQQMKEIGESNNDISEFFDFLAKQCIGRDVPLPRQGYKDLVNLATKKKYLGGK